MSARADDTVRELIDTEVRVHLAQTKLTERENDSLHRMVDIFGPKASRSSVLRAALLLLAERLREECYDV